jgi:hypothetical protein
MYDKQPWPQYKSRPVLYLGVTVPMWVGAAVATLVLAVALFCLLTHQIPF